MGYETEDIARTLKAARERKGLSQRALSAASGVPQGHISRIENAAVDIRVSSLVALARALDLELTLVPRKAVAAVKSVARSSSASQPGAALGLASKELKQLQKRISKILEFDSSSKDLARLLQRSRELENFSLRANDLKSVRNANQALKKLQDTLANSEAQQAVKSIQEAFKGNDALRKALADIEEIRNQLAHSVASLPVVEFPRPAYRLDEEDENG